MKKKKTLKEIRREQRYTLQAVADATGIPLSTYTAYEGGYRTPRVDAAVKIAEFFKVKVEDIDFMVKKK